jgi:hypothetical protein
MGTGAFLSWFLFLLFFFLAFLLFSRVFVESVGAFPDHHIVFPDPLNHRFAGMHMLPHVPCWGVEVSTWTRAQHRSSTTFVHFQQSRDCAS